MDECKPLVLGRVPRGSRPRLWVHADGHFQLQKFVQVKVEVVEGHKEEVEVEDVDEKEEEEKEKTEEEIKKEKEEEEEERKRMEEMTEEEMKKEIEEMEKMEEEEEEEVEQREVWEVGCYRIVVPSFTILEPETQSCTQYTVSFASNWTVGKPEDAGRHG